MLTVSLTLLLGVQATTLAQAAEGTGPTESFTMGFCVATALTPCEFYCYSHRDVQVRVYGVNLGSGEGVATCGNRVASCAPEVGLECQARAEASSSGGDRSLGLCTASGPLSAVCIG